MVSNTTQDNLDLVLRLLDSKPSGQTESAIFVETSGKITNDSLSLLLDKLKKDGYVYSSVLNFQISQDGKIFIKAGGYVAKKERENEIVINSNRALHNSIEALAISKKSFRWTIWNTVGVIIATLVSIIVLYFTIWPKK